MYGADIDGLKLQTSKIMKLVCINIQNHSTKSVLSIYTDFNYFESHNTLDYIFNKKSEYSCTYKRHEVTVHPAVVYLFDGA